MASSIGEVELGNLTRLVEKIEAAVQSVEDEGNVDDVGTGEVAFV